MVRRNSPRERRDERGFTLVELMIVVVIVAVLAAVMVPMFTSEAKKVSAKSEVVAMFAELATKQERYKNENSVYLAVAACPSGTLSRKPQSLAACQVAGSPWANLGVLPPQDTLACSYEVTVGDSATAPTTTLFAGAVYTVPTGCCATGWYIMHAKCDMDSNGNFSHYISASFDTRLQITRDGN